MINNVNFYVDSSFINKAGKDLELNIFKSTKVSQFNIHTYVHIVVPRPRPVHTHTHIGRSSSSYVYYDSYVVTPFFFKLNDEGLTFMIQVIGCNLLYISKLFTQKINHMSWRRLVYTSNNQKLVGLNNKK